MKKLDNEKIGQYVIRLLMSGSTLGNEQIVALVKQEFPTAETTSACIAWYKSDLKKKIKNNKITITPKEVTVEEIEEEILSLEEKIEELKEKAATMRQAKEEEQRAKTAELLKGLSKEDLMALLQEKEAQE